ncbi:hypothetical protein O6H91_03G085300 [Diphasiastrum complanatum]|uniref:Uncharacterized protein n=1 Tax=Diphasiastrum complanatum TaxID=34168 RepID=A0ACC2E8P0_DIPCM|nr:hypothetical protein O6H91_03G085300 [Diphasiastrum complanatum]
MRGNQHLRQPPADLTLREPQLLFTIERERERERERDRDACHIERASAAIYYRDRELLFSVYYNEREAFHCERTAALYLRIESRHGRHMDLAFKLLENYDLLHGNPACCR